MKRLLFVLLFIAQTVYGQVATKADAVLDSRQRQGTVKTVVVGPVGQTAGTVLVYPDLTTAQKATALSLTVEQSPDGGTSWLPVVGGSCDDITDCVDIEIATGRSVISLSWTEQVIRDDVLAKSNWPTKRTVPTDQAQLYYQLTTYPTVRVSVDTKVPLTYSVDWLTEDKQPSEVLLGHHSASLLGTFTGASGTTAGLTTSSRTSTAGSTITGGESARRATTIPTSLATTDNQSNTFTDAENTTFQTRIALAYNVAGTRAAGHTVTCTLTGGSGTINHGCNAAEFDGIAISPTIVGGNAGATGTTWSGTVTTSKTSLVVANTNVASTNRAPTVTGGTQAIQTNGAGDGNVTIGYKVAQAAGTPGISGTIADSQSWQMILWAFEESGGAVAATPQLTLMGIGK